MSDGEPLFLFFDGPSGLGTANDIVGLGFFDKIAATLEPGTRSLTMRDRLGADWLIVFASGSKARFIGGGFIDPGVDVGVGLAPGWTAGFEGNWAAGFEAT